MDGAPAIVVGPVLAAVVAATVGWLVHAARARRHAGTLGRRRRLQLDRAATAVLAVAAVAVVLVAPVVGVFAVVVALNHLLGTGEHVPFSRYPMFADPGERVTSLRFEDPAGDLVDLTSMGIRPSSAHKHFDAVVRAARSETGDRVEARRMAAAELADRLRQRRPRHGRLATEPITIVLVDHELDRGHIRSTRTVLAVAGPR
jgi:hypothetical protein